MYKCAARYKASSYRERALYRASRSRRAITIDIRRQDMHGAQQQQQQHSACIRLGHMCSACAASHCQLQHRFHIRQIPLARDIGRHGSCTSMHNSPVLNASSRGITFDTWGGGRYCRARCCLASSMTHASDDWNLNIVERSYHGHTVAERIEGDTSAVP